MLAFSFSHKTRRPKNAAHSCVTFFAQNTAAERSASQAALAFGAATLARSSAAACAQQRLRAKRACVRVSHTASGHGERERIIARARAMARGLGLDDMSDEALYDTVVQKRASLNRDAAAALTASTAVHARLAAVQHEDHMLRRSDFGLGGVRRMRVRVYVLPMLLVASEVREATSNGQQRALWACSALAGASRQAERVAIFYTAPLPFRRCFLQRVSPPLSEFAVLLRNFPWLPLGTSCRDAISFFDWASQTDGFDAAAKFVAWQNMGGAARRALVQRRAAACEARVRRQLARAAGGGGYGLGGGAHGAQGADASSGDLTSPSATPPPGAAPAPAASVGHVTSSGITSSGVTSPSPTPVGDATRGGADASPAASVEEASASSSKRHGRAARRRGGCRVGGFSRS